MATRSFIARFDTDTETYHSIYCHWDGYPTGVGLTLRDCYDIDEKVKFLIDNGDISSLRGTVVETKEEAYKNRGDTDVDAKVFKSLTEMEEYYRSMWCEYGYLWMDGQWNCYGLNIQTINLYDLNREVENV
jgi:hypothetical protein